MYVRTTGKNLLKKKSPLPKLLSSDVLNIRIDYYAHICVHYYSKPYYITHKKTICFKGIFKLTACKCVLLYIQTCCMYSMCNAWNHVWS